MFNSKKINNMKTKLLIVIAIFLSVTTKSQIPATVYDAKEQIGLTGSGTVDESAALNAFIANLPSNAHIHFPTGQYLINTNVLLLDKQIYLDGDNATILTTANISIFTFSSTVAGASKCEVKNLNFKGNDSGSSQMALNFSENSGLFKVENNNFNDFGFVAARVANTETSDVLGGEFISNRFISNDTALILGNRGEYVKVTVNDFIGNSHAVYDQAGNSIVGYNNIAYNGTGVEIASGANNGHGIYSHNNVNHNTVIGFNIHDTPYGMTLDGNHIYQNPIKVATTTGVQFKGGIIDVNSYTFTTNSGLEFNGVKFDTGYGNTITQTGTKPNYVGCSNLGGSAAIDADNFIATAFALTSTTEQLRLGYDVSNYVKFNVASTGATTLDVVGSSATMTHIDPVVINTISGLESLRLKCTSVTDVGNSFTSQQYQSSIGSNKDLNLNTDFSNPFGNSVENLFAHGTTAGGNYSQYAEACNGDLNVGIVGKAIVAKNSATNIGVIGVGKNTGTSGIFVGGYFSSDPADNPTFTSAASIFDNGSGTAPISLWRDNGTVKISVVDGGYLKFDANNSTGSGTPLLGSNCPASTLTAPYTWIEIRTSDGSTAYIPVWK